MSGQVHLPRRGYISKPGVRCVASYPRTDRPHERRYPEGVTSRGARLMQPLRGRDDSGGGYRGYDAQHRTHGFEMQPLRGKITRTFAGVLIVILNLAFCSVLCGQDDPKPDTQVFALTLRPNGPPIPSFRYEFIPSFRNQSSTNAALLRDQLDLAMGLRSVGKTSLY